MNKNRKGINGFVITWMILLCFTMVVGYWDPLLAVMGGIILFALGYLGFDIVIKGLINNE